MDLDERIRRQVRLLRPARSQPPRPGAPTPTRQPPASQEPTQDAETAVLPVPTALGKTPPATDTWAGSAGVGCGPHGCALEGDGKTGDMATGRSSSLAVRSRPSHEDLRRVRPFDASGGHPARNPTAARAQAGD
jgi:hypothetical protein